MTTEKFANLALSTLNGAISAGATSLVVTSATSFPTSGNFRIRIDSEIMIVTAVSGTTFTVTRGADGTSAAAHANAAPVRHVATAQSLALLARQNVGPSLGWFNVKEDYGAVGDGSNDDTAAINAAIAAANAAGGGVVYLPAGIYKITAPLTTLGYSVILRGVCEGGSYEPAGTRIYSYYTGTDAIMSPGYFGSNASTFNGFENFTLRCMVDTSADYKTSGSFDQTKFDQQGQAGIEARLATHFHIRHVKVIDFPIGICLDGAETVLIERCFTGSYGTGYADYAAHSRGVWMTYGVTRNRGNTTAGATNNITIKDSVIGGAVNIYSEDGINHLIDGCNFEGGIHLLQVHATYNVVIKSFVCEGYTGAPIYISGAATCVSITDSLIGTTGDLESIAVNPATGCSQLRVENCLLYGNPAAITGATYIDGMIATNNILAHAGADITDADGSGASLITSKNGSVVCGVSINRNRVPRATIDARIIDRTYPFLRLSAGGYELFHHLNPSDKKHAVKRFTVSHATGYLGGVFEVNEGANFAPAGAVQDLASFPLEDNSFVVIEYTVTQFKYQHPEKYGLWKRRRKAYKWGGGIVFVTATSADTAADVSEDTDGSFTAPTLIDDGSGNIAIRVSSHPTEYSYAQADVHVTYVRQ